MRRTVADDLGAVVLDAAGTTPLADHMALAADVHELREEIHRLRTAFAATGAAARTLDASPDSRLPIDGRSR